MKSMVVLLTSRIKEAARLCGMSPSRWVSKRLYEAATNDIQRAHVALLDANVRDKHEIMMREQAARERARRADEVAREQDRQAFREQLEEQARRLGTPDLEVNLAALRQGFATSGPLTPEEQQVSNYNRDVDNGLVIDRDELIKQCRNDYFDKYGEGPSHSGEAHIWQIYQDVAALDRSFTPTEHLVQVLRRMHVYKLNGTEPQIKPV